MTIRYEPGYAHIEGHEFWKFLEEVQEVTAKGYVLDISNERFPTQFVGYWSAYFVEGLAPVTREVVEEAKEAQADLDAKVEELRTEREVAEQKGEENTTEEPKAQADAPRRGRPPRNR